MAKPIKEDIHTEFKSSFNDAVIESLSAFANTKGGRVLVGMTDKVTPVKGFTLGSETLQKWINEVKNKTQPSIIPDANIIHINGVDIGELTISEFPIKPVSFKGRYYKRVNNSNHMLSLSEIADMHLKSFNTSWDSYINPEKSIDMLSLEKVNTFITNCNNGRQYIIADDPLTVLNKYDLIKEGQVTHAGYLMFARNDVFDATIELGRFSTPTSIKDGITIRSDLFSEVELVLDFVRKHINKSYIITGDPRREERWQYPMDALREIAINMIVHRDYTHYGDSSVKIYDDYIEFFNPGRLPENITVDQLLSGDYSSQARNRKVASAFKEAQFIEKYGSGIKRIKEGFANHGLKQPVFENFQHGFRVLVYAQDDSLLEETVGETVGETLRETLRGTSAAVFFYIKDNPHITREELAERAKLSVRGIEYQLAKLRKLKLIERIGSTKGGYWKILE